MINLGCEMPAMKGLVNQFHEWMSYHQRACTVSEWIVSCRGTLANRFAVHVFVSTTCGLNAPHRGGYIGRLSQNGLVFAVFIHAH